MRQLVKLKFTAPVHFGSGRLTDSESYLTADTLFSALFIEALSMGCADELLTAAQSGKLQISDTFPWIGSTYYLPKPRVSPPQQRETASEDEQAASTIKKAFKQLVYIPTSSFSCYLKGSFDPLAEQEKFKLGSSGLIAKVSLERRDDPEASGNPDPYHVGVFSFCPDAGLYFIVQGNYDLRPVLDALQYSGLGGKRSSGYGRFEFEVCDDCVAAAVGSIGDEGKMLLSSAMPKAEELSEDLLEGCSYTLNRRAGFVQSTAYTQQATKKRDFYTFASGSVFARTFDGDVFDVSAGGNHSVWRYAKAMWLEV